MEVLSTCARTLHTLLTNMLRFAADQPSDLSPVQESEAVVELDLVGYADDTRALAEALVSARDLRTSVSTSHLAHTRVRMSRRGLEHIMFAVLANAVDYTPDGGLVEVSFATTSNFLHLEVTDTGVGVPEDLREEIFLPFNRGMHGGFTAQGIGMGLAIAKQYTDAMGGSIAVRARRDGLHGTTFVVRLPYSTAEDHFDSDSPICRTSRDLPSERKQAPGKAATKLTTVLCCDDKFCWSLFPLGTPS
jgi:signal transduction histidine kinase